MSKDVEFVENGSGGKLWSIYIHEPGMGLIEARGFGRITGLTSQVHEVYPRAMIKFIAPESEDKPKPPLSANRVVNSQL